MNNGVDHYDSIATQALSLATEAKIRANGYQEDGTPGWLILDDLADHLYRAVVTATTGLYSEPEMAAICEAADTAAIERITLCAVCDHSALIHREIPSNHPLT